MKTPRSQLELTLVSTIPPRTVRAVRPHQQSSRPTASRWWFARMREAVRIARDWPTAETEGGSVPQSHEEMRLVARPTRLSRRVAVADPSVRFRAVTPEEAGVVPAVAA